MVVEMRIGVGILLLGPSRIPRHTLEVMTEFMWTDCCRYAVQIRQILLRWFTQQWIVLFQNKYNEHGWFFFICLFNTAFSWRWREFHLIFTNNQVIESYNTIGVVNEIFCQQFHLQRTVIAFWQIFQFSCSILSNRCTRQGCLQFGDRGRFWIRTSDHTNIYALICQTSCDFNSKKPIYFRVKVSPEARQIHSEYNHKMPVVKEIEKKPFICKLIIYFCQWKIPP